MERRPIRRIGGPLAALALAVAWAGVLSGCGAEEKPPLSPVAPARPTPKPEPSTGFAESELAARMASTAVPPEARAKLRISPDLRSEILKSLQTSLRAARRSLNAGFIYSYEPPAGAALSDSERGWAWLLRAQRWELEDAIKAEDWAVAATRAGETLRMGARMTGGDAGDAMMGASACRWALDLMLPHLKRLPPGALTRLGEDAALALKDLAPPDEVLANQLDATLISVQRIQDGWQSQGRQGMVLAIGKAAKDPGDYLEDKPGKAPAFFTGLRDELLQIHSHFVAVATSPVPLRPAGDPLNPRDPMWLLPGEKKKFRPRPWRDLIPYLMAGHRTISEELPFLKARLQLAAITFQAEAAILARGTALEGLGAYSPTLRTDPYTEEPFGYAASGPQYKVWSAGPDGVNDGGLTDLGATSRDVSVRTSSPR